jgi:hypothetical protein
VRRVVCVGACVLIYYLCPDYACFYSTTSSRGDVLTYYTRSSAPNPKLWRFRVSYLFGGGLRYAAPLRNPAGVGIPSRPNFPKLRICIAVVCYDQCYLLSANQCARHSIDGIRIPLPVQRPAAVGNLPPHPRTRLLRHPPPVDEDAHYTPSDHKRDVVPSASLQYILLGK